MIICRECSNLQTSVYFMVTAQNEYINTKSESVLWIQIPWIDSGSLNFSEMVSAFFCIHEHTPMIFILSIPQMGSAHSLIDIDSFWIIERRR